MNPDQTPVQEKKSKKMVQWSLVGLAVVIVAAIIIAVVVTSHRKRPPTVSSVPSGVAAVGSSAAVGSVSSSPTVSGNSGSGGAVVTISPLYFLSSNATATGNGAATKDGNFQISFMVNANAKPIYFDPVCNFESSKSGVTFQLTDNGVATTSGLGPQSCLIITNSNTKTKNGNYLIPAGASQPFELIVVDRPATSGNYQVSISSVGYSNTDSAGTQLFPLTNTGKPLETASLAL